MKSAAEMNALLAEAKAEIDRLVEMLIDRGDEAGAERLARYEISWNVRMTNRAGQCSYRRREIHLSPSIFRAPTATHAEFINTVRHEAAHAVVGWSRAEGHHGPTWRAMAISLGCTGARCHTMATPAAARRRALPCQKCGEMVSLGPQQYRKATTSMTWYRHGGGCGGKISGIIENQG